MASMVIGGVYKTKAALSMARTKVAKLLPTDFRRAKEVIDSLKRIVDKTLGMEQVDDIEDDISKPVKLTTAVKNKITNFFYREDVSITFPGKKDYVMVRDGDGKRTKMVKHVLVLTLREAYNEFKKEEPEIDISLDCFSKQCPPNVLLRHCLPKNVCVCRYHVNVNFLISALHMHDNDFPRNHRELLTKTTCKQENLEIETCQMGLCKDCQPLGTLNRVLDLLGTSAATAKALSIKYIR